MQRTAVIIGAGPAGLTAAYELAVRTDIKPVVLEQDEYVGGISRTVNFHGNRIDIGGHRFFSKSDRVMRWWLDMIPLESDGQAPVQAGADSDRVMLVRNRKSRIYFMKKFFNYPVSLDLDTLAKLGFLRAMRITLSYMRSVLLPIRGEKNLEEFFINRFGKELYEIFFKSYTEKVWGVPCTEISAEWGAQRVKGLSVMSAAKHFLGALFKRSSDISQKETETSLIERFLYPKFGPGQMWEEAARRMQEEGGELSKGLVADRVLLEGNRIRAVEAIDVETGDRTSFEGDYFFSTMPVKDLVMALDPPAPEEIRKVADRLPYRDFITVGILLDRLRASGGEGGSIDDNWIYIQDAEVMMGRVQIFNNWSPYLVSDPEKTWVGLEYFCDEGDQLWSMEDSRLTDFATAELEKLGFIERGDVLDSVVIRMRKAYPAYFGEYSRFNEIRRYLDGFENLFLVGRNGMHRYNNQDHSMLTAMVAVDNIIEGVRDRSNIWAVNTEEQHIES